MVESVQFFRVKANFNVKAETALNDLAMEKHDSLIHLTIFKNKNLDCRKKLSGPTFPEYSLDIDYNNFNK